MRSLISRCLVLRSGAIQVRLERARAEGRGKAGEKKEGVGRSVWLGECLEALEWLAGHEDETGGRKVGGVGPGTDLSHQASVNSRTHSARLGCIRRTDP